jgi:NTE family protein
MLSPESAQSPSHKIAVALQGGGSHGAFTWGVLDRLLTEPSFDIVGISGTSAGAMNAGVLADGLRRGGPAAARQALENYWQDVGAMPGFAALSPFTRPSSHVWSLDSNPWFLWTDMLTRIWSPYEMNPGNFNPLRGLLERIDFEGLRNDVNAARIFICATNVRTGRRRVFENAELSVDVLLASACLPQMYQAVSVGGEPYWDGGYTGNPALGPLYVRTNAADVVVIGINPLERKEIPKTARDIINRVDEISFNSSFMLELSAIAFVEELYKSGGTHSRFKPLFLHGIEDKVLADFGASSKMNNDIGFLRHLHDVGWHAADRWAAAHLADVGRKSSVDLSELIPFKDEIFAKQASPGDTSQP